MTWFNIIAWFCIIIVILELIGFSIFIFFLLTSDDIIYEDNNDGNIICDTFKKPCIKSKISNYDCYSCVLNSEKELKKCKGDIYD